MAARAVASAAGSAAALLRGSGGRHLHVSSTPARYAVSAMLGQGTFGRVHRCTDLETGTPRALKTVEKSLARQFQGLDDAIAMEMQMMRHVGMHPHIAGLVDSFETPTEWGLVLELCDGQRVFDRLAKYGAFGEVAASALTRQVALALRHIHAAGVCHRDVKLENLVYLQPWEHAATPSPATPSLAHALGGGTTRDREQLKSWAGNVQLCDFGVSQPCGGAHGRLRGMRGSLPYMAPEMLVDGAEYGREVDMWGLGVILYEVLSGRNPFDPTGRWGDELVIRRINSFSHQRLEGKEFEHVSAPAKAVLRGLLQPDPALRLTAAQLLAFPWVCHLACGP